MLASLALEQSERIWDYFDLLQCGAIIVSGLILVSAADDLFIDACYWGPRIAGRRTELALQPDALRATPERPLAIMIPAWAERDVIRSMLERLVKTLDYGAYVVFVGTYPNDPETIAEVEQVTCRHGRVVRVEVPNPGPTCKADCLNAIVSALCTYEARCGQSFAGAVLHDSEDVVHPLELRLFNRMLDDFDLIQLPVAALERRWWDSVSGTYMDEFAEWHGKDLIVRERLSGTVLSAGVGTCFSHRALAALTREAGAPFNTATLTEDYDVSERLARVGMRSTIALWPVRQRIARAGFRRTKRSSTAVLPLCVHEYFPNSLAASVRQKARWTIGIALQGWAQLGWSRRALVNYFLFRDRKAIVTSLISLAVYFLIFNVALLALAAAIGAWRGPMPEVFVPEGPLRTLVMLNAVAFLLRLGQRAWFVSRLYGWENGVLSVPRMIAGTLINAFATVRALRLYLVSQWSGAKLAWDKTMHDFPTGHELAIDEPFGTARVGADDNALARMGTSG